MQKSYHIYCEDFVSGDSFRVTGSTTKNVLECIKDATALNEKHSQSRVYTVWSKMVKSAPVKIWEP